MKISNILLCIFAAGFFSSFVFAQPVNKENVKYLDNSFYKVFLNSSEIERDSLLSEFQNKIVQGRAYVESVDKFERYHRRFRITAIDKESNYLNIRLYLYTDNEEYFTLLKRGDQFDYKGQFVIHTPLSSRKDAYIFDIILEELALIIY
ncbi:MAG: hypothetical protein JW864_03355 [Spirochaetes bacterium]|nr:hypothetical protein [Spirochaetota bacterium]